MQKFSVEVRLHVLVRLGSADAADRAAVDIASEAGDGAVQFCSPLAYTLPVGTLVVELSGWR